MKRTNEARAEMGRKVEKAYLDSGGGDKEDDESTVVDIIADLLHYAHHYCLEVNTIIRRATAHYEAELMVPWTVILLLPGGGEPGNETYMAHVQAIDPDGAIKAARQDAYSDNLTGMDLTPLFVGKGHIEDHYTIR